MLILDPYAADTLILDPEVPDVPVPNPELNFLEFPNVEENFKTALYEVLAPYLCTGTVQQLQCEMTSFYNIDLSFDVEKVRTPTTKPILSIVGSQVQGYREFKCDDPCGQRPFGYIRQQNVTRTVYLSIGKTMVLSSPPYLDPSAVEMATWRTMDRIWAQFSGVLESRRKELTEKGIMNATVDHFPTQIQDKDFFIYFGRFKALLQYGYTRGV